jgi:hypothetical protein
VTILLTCDLTVLYLLGKHECWQQGRSQASAGIMMIKAKEPAKGKQSELFYPEAGGCTLL